MLICRLVLTSVFPCHIILRVEQHIVRNLGFGNVLHYHENVWLSFSLVLSFFLLSLHQIIVQLRSFPFFLGLMPTGMDVMPSA